jgi:hypothetical protein
MHPLFIAVLGILNPEMAELDLRNTLNKGRHKSECYSQEALRLVLQGMVETGILHHECRPVPNTSLMMAYYKKIEELAIINGLWSVPHLSLATDKLEPTNTIIIAATAEDAVEKWKKLASTHREYPHCWQEFSGPVTAHPLRAYM